MEGNLGQKGGLVHAYSSYGFSLILTSQGYPSRIVFPPQPPPPPSKKKNLGLKNSRSTSFSTKLTRILIGSRLVRTQCEPLFFFVHRRTELSSNQVKWQTRLLFSVLRKMDQPTWQDSDQASQYDTCFLLYILPDPGLQSQCEVKQNKESLQTLAIRDY